MSFNHSATAVNGLMHYGHPSAGWGCGMLPIPPPGYPSILPPHYGPSGMAPTMPMPSGGGQLRSHATAPLDHTSSLSAFHQQSQQQYDYHQQIQIQQLGYLMAAGSGGINGGGPSTVSKALQVKNPPDIIARQQG